MQQASNFLAYTMRTSNRAPETKGNIFIPLDFDKFISEPKIILQESTKRMIELEYDYAKDNAMLNVGQRGSMMQIYFAAVAIISGAITAITKDQENLIAHKETVLLLSLLAVVASVYTMRGMILLRSDWCDYCRCMASIKIFMLLTEEVDIRLAVMNKGYQHDPFHTPSRQLRTNFWYLSYALCVVISSFFFLLSALCATTIAIGPVSYLNIENNVAEVAPWWSVAIILLFITISAFVANRLWVIILRAPRSKKDRSPRPIPTDGT